MIIEDGVLIKVENSDIINGTIIIPDGVNKIGENAFSNCTNLRNINIPQSVTEIGGRAFDNCKNLTSINIPQNVTRIGEETFNKCENLTSINLPEGITQIEGGAFSNCTNLRNINIPQNVTQIGYKAFCNCKNLTSINIPQSVTRIGGSAFNNCENLTSINFPEGITQIEGGAFSNCTNLRNINIPQSVTEIGGSAFDNCKNLTSINLPEGITGIRLRAFAGCINLRNINIPQSVTRIGDEAFYKCENLTSINLPKGLTQIESSMFAKCINLRNINIPQSVTRIEANAFYKCENLTSINLPKGLTQIEPRVFAECRNLRNINIPQNVTKICKGAFCKCENLKSINLPEGLTQIEPRVFAECRNLRNINIPQNVTKICKGAFCKCENLKSIKIPQSVTQIENEAFYKCENLTSINLPEGLTQIEPRVLAECRNLRNINIPQNVTQIGNDAFYNCKNITSINIPQNLNAIRREAFLECKISNIIFPQDVTKTEKEKLFNDLYETNIQETEKFLFGENLERIERIKAEAYFQNIVRNEEYDEKLMDIFYFRMLNSIGLDEIERMLEMPSLTKEQIQKYSLERDEAFLELYDTRYKINGDLGITLKLLKQLQLNKKVQNKSEKNNLEIRMFKKINEKLEEGYNGTLTNLISQILDEQQTMIEPEFIKKIEELEKSINKALVKENLSKVQIKIKEALRTPNEQYPEAIVPMQITPIKAMIEDTITNLFKEIGYIDHEKLKNMLEVKISHAHAPYIVQKKDQIVSNILELLKDKEFSEIINHSGLEALKDTKEQIGEAWKYKLNKSLKQIGLSFSNLSDILTKEQVEKLARELNIGKIETSTIAVLKEGAEREKAYELLREKGLPEVVTYKQIHDMFGNVKEPYSEKFRHFYKQNRKSFLEDPECIIRFGQIHNNFEQIINSPELKNIYDKGELTLDAIIGYLNTRSYNNQRTGDEELAKLSKSVGQITTEEEFAHVQKIFDITRKRERSTIPPVNITKNKFRGRMLAPDDVLNLFAGNITTCCQRFGDVGEGAMLLGSIEENGGIFVIEELEENGEVKNIIGQSLTIRQKGKNGEYDRLTFDNIEIDDNVLRYLSDKDHAEILQIYIEASKQAIEKDKKFLGNLLKQGKITQEQYDKIVLKEVVAGTGYNDLNGLSSLTRGTVAIPEEAFYRYNTINGDTIYPWIDSAGGKTPKGAGGTPVILASMNEKELTDIRKRAQSRDSFVQELKPKDIPLWYGNVGKVQTFTGNKITEKEIGQIKKIEEKVYRKEQQLLNKDNVKDVEDLEYTYNINNPYIKIGSNKDWYIIYGDNEEEIVISDLAVIGGIHSEKNKTSQDTSKQNTKLAIMEASNEIYEIFLQSAGQGKRIYCNATADTSLINIQRLLKQECIEVKTMNGQAIKYEQGKGLVYEDGTQVKNSKWSEDSEIQMLDLEIIPKVQELQESKKKIEKLLGRIQELSIMSGTAKEEELDELRNEIRKVENTYDDR